MRRPGAFPLAVLIVGLFAWGVLYTAAYHGLETRLERLQEDLEKLQNQQELQWIYVLTLREDMARKGLKPPSLPAKGNTDGSKGSEEAPL